LPDHGDGETEGDEIACDVADGVDEPERRQIHTFPLDRAIPRPGHGRALEDGGDDAAEAVEEDEDDGEVGEETVGAEGWGAEGEDAEVEEEDGGFGAVDGELVEDLGGVEGLEGER
ncbi:MAG: hypothetical protein LQ352_002975, partial [Teloschistes flavicans]